MQCSPYSALSGEEFTDHFLNTTTESGLIEIDSEDVLATVKIPQTAEVVIAAAHLQWSYDGLQLFKHGIGRWREGVALIIDAASNSVNKRREREE